MAHAAGQDPYQFRRAMLDRADYLGVLEQVVRDAATAVKASKALRQAD